MCTMQKYTKDKKRKLDNENNKYTVNDIYFYIFLDAWPP